MSHPPLLELSWREALPPEDQTFRNSEKAPDTHARLDILGFATLKQGGEGCDAPPFKKCNINSQSLVLNQMAHATICRNIRVDYHLEFGRFGSTAVPNYSVSETKSESVQILKAIFP